MVRPNAVPESFCHAISPIWLGDGKKGKLGEAFVEMVFSDKHGGGAWSPGIQRTGRKGGRRKAREGCAGKDEREIMNCLFRRMRGWVMVKVGSKFSGFKLR
jgi:hypothetical protein